LWTTGLNRWSFIETRKALEEPGATTEIVSPQPEVVKAWNHSDWGDKFHVDITVEEADPAKYDALLLPGGVMNPDKLRHNSKVLQFVRSFANSNKPIAAICHALWTLIDAGIVKGRRLTSYESLRTDLKNAGANWVDEEVVVDDHLVTSREPTDIPAFNKKMVETIAQGTRVEMTWKR
jgi:deglycase